MAYTPFLSLAILIFGESTGNVKLSVYFPLVGARGGSRYTTITTVLISLVDATESVPNQPAWPSHHSPSSKLKKFLTLSHVSSDILLVLYGPSSAQRFSSSSVATRIFLISSRRLSMLSNLVISVVIFIVQLLVWMLFLDIL